MLGSNNADRLRGPGRGSGRIPGVSVLTTLWKEVWEPKR